MKHKKIQTQSKAEPKHIQSSTLLPVFDTQKEELDLLQRILDDDKHAWAVFCRRYESLIIGCVLRVLRRYNVSFSADDLADYVAEVWVTLLRDNRRKLHLFDASRGYKFASWLGLLATNCTIDQLRMRPLETAYLEDLSFSDQLLTESLRPDKKIEQDENAMLARRALNELTVEEKQFIYCCYHEEQPPVELAEDLGIAVNTVYSRKFKIREKLIRLVADLHQNETFHLAA